MASLRVGISFGHSRWPRASTLMTVARNQLYTSKQSSVLPNSYTRLQITDSFSAHRVNTEHAHSHVSACFMATKSMSEVNPLSSKEHNKAGVESKSVDESNNGPTNNSAEDQDFSEVLARVEKSYSKSVIKDYEFTLNNLEKLVADLENKGKAVELNELFSDDLESIVNVVLTPSAPPYMRQKCAALFLSQSSDLPLTEKLLMQTVSDAMTVPVNVLVSIIQALTASAETPLRRNVRKELVTVVVNKRWYEIPPKHIVFFLYQLDGLFEMKSITQELHMSGHAKNQCQDDTARHDAGTNKAIPDVVQSIRKNSSDESMPIMSANLEARLLQIMDEIKAKDLTRVVILLAKWRNRNPSILTAVVHRLSHVDFSDFNFIQLSNLLFASSLLSLQNNKFISELTLHLSQLVPPSPSLACSVLNSLSHLRWRDLDLISSCQRNLIGNLGGLSPKEATNLLMSLANLSVLPSSHQESQFIRDVCRQAEGQGMTTTDRIKRAWCLAILKSLDAQQAELLLNPDFVQNILVSGGVHTQLDLQRLSVINMAAKFEINNFKGQCLSDEILNSTKITTLCSDETLTAALVNVLSKFADLKTYTQLAVLEGGTGIDAVMNATSDGDVRPLTQNNKKTGTERVFRIALQLIPFTGVTNPSYLPTGPYQLVSRYLKHLGYVPVQVLYSDLKPSLGVLEQISNIRSRIKKALVDNN
ncbi:unnamed protein product [Lymnaea stagnalis]|uniref:RAP domain-containing protein n=1 Tax=Lymnaea stagnalis TaxID=6523 RepID=A0AAV2HIU3_LYMST